MPTVLANTTLPPHWQDGVIIGPTPVTVVGSPVVVVGSPSGGVAKTFSGGETAELHPFGDAFA
ncbi:MAG TPA: hypothetical protein VMZ71_16495, partial [Gemmataceae bacterium]|nr:hypothetical protein [Gemmataceae bacterium]